jgi:hypothetical protein
VGHAVKYALAGALAAALSVAVACAPGGDGQVADASAGAGGSPAGAGGAGARGGAGGGAGNGGASPAAGGGGGSSAGGSGAGAGGIGIGGSGAAGGTSGGAGAGGGPTDGSPDVPPAGDTSSETTATRGKKILFVVGNENGTSMRGDGIGDRFLRSRLETMLGHTVTMGGDNSPAAQLQTAAAQADLVIVSESVGSAMLQGKLKPVATPILNYEAFIQDEMGLTPPGPPGDPGLPADFALGVKANETRIDIVMPAHALAAGFAGAVAVYRMPRSITWGKVAASAEVVATLSGDRAGVAIYVYRKGARLQDGTTAAGLRVGFFLEDDDTTGTANLMTEDGLRLLDAAVAFALDPSNGAPVAP